MDNEVTKKTESTKKTGVWMRLFVPTSTHSKIKKFNRSVPRERMDITAVRLIQKGLEANAPVAS
jgi:hypothetical protein